MYRFISVVIMQPSPLVGPLSPAHFSSHPPPLPSVGSEGVWVYTSPSPRFGHTMVALEDRYICIFGGCSHNCFALNSMDVYDTVKRCWFRPATAHAGEVPSPRTHHSAVLWGVDHSMVVFGGSDQNRDIQDTLHAFSFNHGWVPGWVASLAAANGRRSPPPSSKSLACLANDSLYVFGEEIDGPMFAFDCSHREWRQIEYSGRLPMCYRNSAVCIGGKVVCRCLFCVVVVLLVAWVFSLCLVRCRP